MPEFVKAYEPDGMKPKEFVTYGVTQRTLCQFVESGWKLMEELQARPRAKGCRSNGHSH